MKNTTYFSVLTKFRIFKKIDFDFKRISLKLLLLVLYVLDKIEIGIFNGKIYFISCRKHRIENNA